MTEVRVKICRLNKSANLPAYAKPGDSGLDLQSMEDYQLFPGVPVRVSTGIAIGLPDGYEAQVRGRSGLNARGVWCPLGTVDRGYTGEVGVVLLNVGDEMQRIAKGDRVAQLVVMPVPRVTLDEVENAEALGVTERGARGWGSTGS